MKVAIFSRQYSQATYTVFKTIIAELKNRNIQFFILKEFVHKLEEELDAAIENTVLFEDHATLKELKPDYLISIGGDGTFLNTLELVKDSGIPVFGINTGRLGFLSNLQPERIRQALKELQSGNYRIDKRSLLQFKSDQPFFNEQPFALNDFTIHKRDSASMITIKTFINGELFNTYWADGLIVATPTGSTAYSLSCGGPIIFPDSKTFVITPVAPHNLNVRPVLVSDDAIVSFEVSGRGTNFLASLDSNSEIADYSCQFAVMKAPFSINILRFENQKYIRTLREKLMWGMDTRNN